MPGDPQLRHDAAAIWQAAVAAVRADDLVRAAFAEPGLGLREALADARRILVVGAGKAGAAMSAGLELALADSLDKVEGLVNVPAQSVRPLEVVRLHAARPAGTNQPTPEGVAGTRAILDLVATAAPDEVCICLLSGGGSALLPSPVEGVTLEDKQHVTRLLHACGATINEMNAVRKHLSLSKGGQLARRFTGGALHSLIVSDVVDDPVDVIASGPTAADPTTFADALAVLGKYRLLPGRSPQQAERPAPPSVIDYLREGAAGRRPETLKALPPRVHNHIIGNNGKALAAAKAKAQARGYRVVDLGSCIEGETQDVAAAMAGTIKSIRGTGETVTPPVCLLSGGETTVTLSQQHGLGGRNQEFVLAAACKLGMEGLRNTLVLSGGTDGEDGPTDAAGAIVTSLTLEAAARLGIDPHVFLAQHNAYHFFAQTGDLLKTGLTETNVMDVRVILVC
jgi:hydroxypyruvate reductase/glycerate 2-kinase